MKGMATVPPPGPRPRGAALLGPRNSPGTAALLVGLVSVALSVGGGWVAMAGVLAAVTGVLAFCLGWAGRHYAARGLATNGAVALVGLLLGVAGLLVGCATLWWPTRG